MNPFKMFELHLNKVTIDGEFVLKRPKYISTTDWIDFWTSAALEDTYGDGYEAGYRDGKEE